jgi:hypothetical protein
MMTFKGFFALLLAALLTQSVGRPQQQPGILKLLPSEKDLSEWKPLFEPQTAEGQDLYLLINGGAEIYQEYGFKRAVLQSYENPKRRSLNLEIYEMESPGSAYGIYTFKTGKKGKRIAVGNDALLEDYFLNFWKGSYVVTLIGFGSEDETSQGLLDLAKVIDSKLPGGGKRPALVACLTEEDHEPAKITYMLGNLALFNRYEFDTENIFGLREGVIGEYEGYKIFIFRYSDESESLRWYVHAVDTLRANPKFKSEKQNKHVFSAIDSKGLHIRIEPHRNDIIVVLSTDPDDAAAILEKQKARLERLSNKR